MVLSFSFHFPHALARSCKCHDSGNMGSWMWVLVIMATLARTSMVVLLCYDSGEWLLNVADVEGTWPRTVSTTWGTMLMRLAIWVGN